jgi:hypothetical protein
MSKNKEARRTYGILYNTLQKNCLSFCMRILHSSSSSSSGHSSVTVVSRVVSRVGMTSIISIGTPSGPSVSTCGYCSPPGQRSESETSYITAGLQAHQLSSKVCPPSRAVELFITNQDRFIRKCWTVAGGVPVFSPMLAVEQLH